VAADATLPLWVDISEDGEPTVVPSTGVTTEFIADQAVTAAKIANDTITAAQIAANAVGSSELADNAVDTNAIADSAVTSAKIADGTIATGDLADGAVTPAKLATTGRFTFPTGAANGYGFASGAVHLSGTAAPEGVVSAALGSTYLQTSGAATVTGMMSWRKTSGGTGATGWSPEGALADTGWRKLSTWDTAGTVTGAALGVNVVPASGLSGGMLVRRVGQLVTLRITNLTTTGSVGELASLPSYGFRAPYSATYGFGNRGVMMSVNSSGPFPLEVANTIARASNQNITAGTVLYSANVEYVTSEPSGAAEDWPSSLPGSA